MVPLAAATLPMWAQLLGLGIGGASVGMQGANMFGAGRQKQYPTAPQPVSLGETFMSAGGTMPSNMNLYPKQPSTQQPGSLLGNSGYGGSGSQLLQYLMGRR